MFPGILASSHGLGLPPVSPAVLFGVSWGLAGGQWRGQLESLCVTWGHVGSGEVDWANLGCLCECFLEGLLAHLGCVI